MAKAKAKANSNRGGGDLSQQIARLEEKVGKQGIKTAKAIAAEHDPEVIKLAFKYIPKGPSNGSLGTRIENMLANLPAGEAADMREKLLAAKAAS